MTTQPDHRRELIPRPERTPDSVRAALARIAPYRLSEMEQHKEEVPAAGIQDGKIGHLQHRLTHWQTQVEIERRPDFAGRYHVALAVVHGTSDR